MQLYALCTTSLLTDCNSQDFPSVKTVQLYRISTQTDLAIIYINKELL